MAANVPLLVPLIVKAIQLVPAAQEMAQTKAAMEGKLQIGMAYDISNKLAYSEFIALQVRHFFKSNRLKLCRLLHIYYEVL